MVNNVKRRSPGIFSEMERPRQTLHHYGTLLEIDARINLGCSGGALINLHGELVGIVTAHAALVGGDTPGGFAVPLDDTMQRILTVLLQGKEVEYGFLGVQMSTRATPGRGAVLQGVAENSPAKLAGIQDNDVIVTIEGQPVRDNDDLFLLIGSRLAGSTVKIDTARGRTFSVTLAKYHVPVQGLASNRPPARGGLRVDYGSIVAQGGVPRKIPTGVVIREVLRGSPAEQARLQRDDVITHVNGRLVTTPTEYYEEMARAAGTVELTYLTADNRSEKVTLALK
jgi:S1-C subfamily serine protease